MKTSDFDYYVPKELVAQKPLKQRDRSRLLYISRDTGAISHYIFKDLPSLIKPGDHLVFNDTRVIPARIFCRKDTGGKVEIFFLNKIDKCKWKANARPARRLKKNIVIALDEDRSIKLRIEDCLVNGTFIVSINGGGVDSIEELMKIYGKMPLPPYIRRDAQDTDKISYQTVYAENEGAVAAPTAGLHFSDILLKRLEKSGINFSFVTLHVGTGTFRPVKKENPLDHKMHEEKYLLSANSVNDIMETKNRGGRIIAVGTTVVRVLEYCTEESGILKNSSGTTRLMILPGYRFKIVDGIITNFHLPRSTLLMLVSAFAGIENTLTAYKKAVERKYRFFSYGDAMLIL